MAMTRGNEKKNNNNNGWGNMSSSDYHDHIMRLVRTPSVQTSDVPRYGNAPMLFRNAKVTTAREAEDKEALRAKVEEKVDFFKQSSADDHVSTAISYAPPRRPGFTICNWKTFNVN